MESFLSRYRNLIVLLFVLLAQVFGLAVQVRRPGLVEANAPLAPSGARDKPDGPGVRLIRLWASELVTPFERGIHGSGEGVSRLWSDYIDLRKTRQQNKDLQQTIDRLRLEQAQILEDAKQGQRLQELVHFQQNYIYKTLAAQVIGTSGNVQSHVLWIDKGSADGVAIDMAVITGDGIVGKVRDVFPHSAQVLVINDQSSGAGVVLETTRTRGILRGNANGQPQVINILADQRIKPGDPVLTAGGDQIFPRGLPVGVVDRVVPDPDRGSFIDVLVKPAANLQHLDEVLVVTSLDAHLSAQQRADLSTSQELKGAEVAADLERKKAAAEMAQRLPGLKDENAPAADPNAPKGPDGKPLTPAIPAAAKPLPAAHADRFTPGGRGEQTGRDGDADTGAASAPKPKKPSPKPDTQQSQTPMPPKGVQ